MLLESLRNLQKGEKPIINPEIFKDKIVFVGSNANSQALQDVKRTPVSDTFAGLDIQATNFNNIEKNEFFTEVSPLYDFIVILTVFILVLLFNLHPSNPCSPYVHIACDVFIFYFHIYYV